MNRVLLKLFVLLFCCSTLAIAAPMDTLKLNVNTSYPKDIYTVSDALMYVLAAADYKIALGLPASESVFEILQKPIPPEARQSKIMPIYQAILLLIGNTNLLVVDSKHRLLTLESSSLRIVLNSQLSEASYYSNPQIKFRDVTKPLSKTTFTTHLQRRVERTRMLPSHSSSIKDSYGNSLNNSFNNVAEKKFIEPSIVETRSQNKTPTISTLSRDKVKHESMTFPIPPPADLIQKYHMKIETTSNVL